MVHNSSVCVFADFGTTRKTTQMDANGRTAIELFGQKRAGRKEQNFFTTKDTNGHENRAARVPLPCLLPQNVCIFCMG